MLSLENLGAAIMDKDDRQKKVFEEEDYIHSPKFGNSLNKYIQKNDEKIDQQKLDDLTIAKLLLISEEDVPRLYQEAVEMLKEGMLDE